ncbi:elongation factor P 5-aminopentanone reductase [Lentibacillus saliphilus]|uniref:elongation factor P 5-aminopentanone reductase n=1 Tax=Lentibacillus saliphilus TaxID=2737028 RepID=UPI001C3011EB|nr:SDR family oxidoreductase [Lentibacillus saliphilus]
MGKNILIIGASGGIGQATAIQLVRDGHQVILHYNKNRSAIDYIIDQVEMTRVLSVIQADLTIHASVEQLLTSLAFTVDAVVFAGGEAHINLFQDTTETVMDHMLMLHVKSPWLISQRLLPGMLQKRAGDIIFISSIWGDCGASMEVVYSSVKGAQNSFVKALAKELAPNGIKVNAISPGYVDTKMNDHLSDEDKQSLLDEIPIKRAATPYDIAQTVRFLIGEATCINGEIIRIDGGWRP